MTTTKPRPELQAMGEAIREAMARKGLLARDVSRAISGEPTGASAYQWMRGANRPTGEGRNKLIELLELDPAVIPEHVPRRGSKEWQTRKREIDRAYRERKRHEAETSPPPAPGPAEQALLAWKGPDPAPPPPARKPTPPPPTPFSAVMTPEGTMRVTLDVTLPFKQATALMQMIFSAQVLIGEEEKEAG